MSLLVAGVADSRVWMVSDTAISGGELGIRERSDWPKIEASFDGMALAGFVGDLHHGAKLIREALCLPAGAEGLKVLRSGQAKHPSAEFAYGYMDDNGPHLVRIADGQATVVPTLHLGSDTAFEMLQRARHDADIDAAEKAVKSLVIGLKRDDAAPKQLTDAIAAMFRVFAERNERDVGGWVVPYTLTKEGAHFCSYAYAISDPILDRLVSGSLVPHGTAEAGGFALSVTELGEGDGTVVYWLQKPGGTVIVRSDDGYTFHDFDGLPTDFKKAANAKLGRTIDLWFSDQSLGIPRKITTLRDEVGNPSMTIADDGTSFCFAVQNVATPFRSEATVEMPDEIQETKNEQQPGTRIEVCLSEDKGSATIRLIQDDQPMTQLALQAGELDELIQRLGEVRSSMPVQVPAEPIRSPGTRWRVVLDPKWRTEMPPHPSLDGILVSLRHLGFGWLAFMLPHHEALSLGKWLCEHADQQASGRTAATEDHSSRETI